MNDRAESGTIKVTVLDEPFRISSEAGPEYTRDVAAHVDRTLRALRDSAPTLEPFPTAVLGAMEITDDLFRARSAAAGEAAELIGRIDTLQELVASALDRAPERRTARSGRSSRVAGKEAGGR